MTGRVATLLLVAVAFNRVHAQWQLLLPMVIPPTVELTKFLVNKLGATGAQVYHAGAKQYQLGAPGHAGSYSGVPQYVTQHAGGSYATGNLGAGSQYPGAGYGSTGRQYLGAGYGVGAGYPYLGGSEGFVATQSPGANSFTKYDPVQTQHGCTCSSIVDGLFGNLEKATEMCGGMPKDGGAVSVPLYQCVQKKMEGHLNTDLVDSDGTLNSGKILAALKQQTGMVVPGAEGCLTTYNVADRTPEGLYYCLKSKCPNAYIP